MSLQEAYALDKETLKIIGFTDLGVHTSEEKKKSWAIMHLSLCFNLFPGPGFNPLAVSSVGVLLQVMNYIQ